ncbi:MAG: hypothetical protein ACRDZO_11950 [Egibacteraceae bacterium]
MHTLEHRIRVVEARIADIEGGYGETLYKLHLSSVRTDLRMAKILHRLEIDDISEAEIDCAGRRVTGVGPADAVNLVVCPQ